MSSLLLSAALQLAALDTSAPDAMPRTFAGIAHSGKPFTHQGKRMVVDLQSLNFKDPTPVLIEHDRARRAGVARLSIGADGLSIAGSLLNNEHGQAVAQEADQGFPWELSAHVQPERIEQLASGQSALVNGQTIHGPIAIYRGCAVREVSFTPTGVDSNTHAVVLSDHPNSPQSSQQENPMFQHMNLEEALAEIAKLQAQIQTLTAEKEKLDAEKQKLEQEKAQAQREQALNVELSARGFTKDEQGNWRGISAQTQALLLSLDKAAQSALLSDLAPKPATAPKALFEPHAPNASDVKLSDNPLLNDAERRAKAQSAFI